MTQSHARLPEAAGGGDDFALRLLSWWDRHGRHDLPWQQGEGGRRDAWRVWVSEVMLQQTQVGTVIPFFERFMARFPDIEALARAGEDEVLACWAGLGYYRRARFLHAGARLVLERHGGAFPRDFEAAVALPGLGRSTAAAILAQAFDLPHAILDGNVKRVLARYHGIEGWPGEGAVVRDLWRHAEAHTPLLRVADYTQAIMDLGATLCTPRNPACGRCPQASGCAALRDGRVDELPAPRPRKVLPVRRVVMWLIESEHGLLLERRPPAGVWPGLYSLPETACEEDAPDGCIAGEGLPRLRHTFSHYHLDIHPRRARLVGADARVMDDGRMLWYNPARPLPGVPAPVRRLIEQYMRNST
ncbi:MAG: A/G-specific adenine glycosylase [Pseudomonadota bacterium]